MYGYPHLIEHADFGKPFDLVHLRAVVVVIAW
jgi:hypothetical protein